MSRYTSSARKAQVQATRQAIVRTARQLFARQGYAGTSMADIAREAGVAIQTIYSSVGSKQALLREMNDLIDQEAGVREIEAQMAAESDPRQVLRLSVRLTRQVMEQCGDIIATVIVASGSEPEMGAILDEGRRRHRAGMWGVAGVLSQSGALRDGLSVDAAAMAMAVITSNESYFQLSRDFGMSFDEAEHWVFATLDRLLLGRESIGRD
jgi:AcrR family transcriptional regulator